MTAATGSLEYAHARLCSRYGERPDEIAWRRIEHVREFAALIDALRASPLRAWTTGIGPTSTPHEIDVLLRERWRALVAEVGSWMPEAWQPATRWCALLVDLSTVQHLARGGAAMAWMQDDAVARELLEHVAASASTVPLRGPFAAFAAAWSEPQRLAIAWRNEWWRRAPHGAADEMLLAELARVLRTHLAAFHDGAVRDGWPLRRALQARLAVLFRRAVLDPAEAFVFLALAALDLERLRGELQRRAAFAHLNLTWEAAA